VEEFSFQRSKEKFTIRGKEKKDKLGVGAFVMTCNRNLLLCVRDETGGGLKQGTWRSPGTDADYA